MRLKWVCRTPGREAENGAASGNDGDEEALTEKLKEMKNPKIQQLIDSFENKVSILPFEYLLTHPSTDFKM